MTYKKISLILLLLIVLISISIITILLIHDTQSSTNYNPQSTPETPIDTIVRNDPKNNVTSDPNFYTKYYSDDITSLEEFPFTGEYFKQYYSFNLNIKKVPFKLTMLDARNFASTREMIEKMYLSNDVSGNLVSSFTGEISNTVLEMGIMNVPVGPTTYMLFGGFIKDGKGFYFQVFLERKDRYNLSEESFGSIYNFNHARNPKEINEILIDISKQNLTTDFFRKFDDTEISKESNKALISERKKYDGFPTTF